MLYISKPKQNLTNFSTKKYNKVLNYQYFHIKKVMFKQGSKNMGYYWLVSDIV